ncbi:MAG: chromosome segregation protein SMC [Chloroflexota bacterium]|nr:chromosome segregation protein SMC [Chloroflexota bacterium]MBI5702889.1 chromosome segregation protein SMC [Chloroflexota bacterium]
MPLRLKSLELQGYKTFASKTTFEFASGITAIVGPNGSGKSNIADALRWVLGEQSYSLLRGKKTEDMIFNGSEHRARASMASAHIVFDNSNGWLPVDFTEVAMTRRAYRDGHNEYLLNDQPVRLRDLNELLSAAGLADRTYTIMGQGLVDASLALKAEERRKLFEEAAGVGLYRSRREEALKRLETTQRNLERVLDIMSELEPRLRSLERQAKRASEYARAQADLKVILREWYGYHWHKAQQELTASREAVRAQEARVQEAREEHARAQAEYNAFRERLSGFRAQLNAWHRQSAELHSQREEISRELAVLEERRRALLSLQTSALAEGERLSDEERLAQERLLEAEQEITRLQAEYEEAQRQYEEVQRILQERQSERALLEEQLRAARERIETRNAQRAEAQARLDELKQRLETLAAKIEAANQTVETAERLARQAGEQYEAAQSKRDELEAQLRQAEEIEQKSKQEVERLENERRANSEKGASLLAAHTRVTAQLEVLEQAEQSLAGYAEGARFLLEAARQMKLRGARGALSAALDVPAELETAIAAALGDTLDAVLLDGNEIEDALQLLESNEAGRAVLLPVHQDSQTSEVFKASEIYDAIGVASELVHAPEELRPAVRLILGQTLIVRDRAAARQLVRDLPPHARVVTLRGEVFRGDGLIIAGKSASRETSALSRPRQKRELTEALTVLNGQIEALNREAEALSERLREAQRNWLEAAEAARRARVSVGEAEELEKQAGLESEAKRRELEWQKSQLVQLKAEAAEAESLQKSLTETLSRVEAELAKADEEGKEISARLSGMDLAEVQGQVSYWATRAAVAERALADALARREERAREAGRFETRRSEMSSRLEEAAALLAELDVRKAGLHERESVLREQIEALNVEMSPAERELETAEAEEARLQEMEANAQRALATAERLHGQVQLEQLRKQEALDNLRQKIMDDFGLVMFEYAEDVSGPVPLPFEGMVEELPVVAEVSADLEAQLIRQRTQVRRMGPINPEAKQEYDRESERYTFMKAQVEDLRKAEEDLRKVIAELDELTRQEFAKTFDAVDKQFRAMFTRLFGGGSARLSLTDPDNLVETGIEIETRLPGRREQSLALLSGGERSLTAVALVFALLKVSPTPLCVMDEVDAMLDEANVGRFRDLLVELSQDTQFIIITHNRNTVQAADVIYGVTMGRDSASQVISLRLDQVTDEMLKRG